MTPDGADGARARLVADGVALARDLVNTPSNDMGPDELETAGRTAIDRPRRIGERPSLGIDWMSGCHVTSIIEMTVTPTGRVRRSAAAIVMTAMLLVVGCGSDAPNSSGGDESAEAPVELPPMHVVAGLGYPRDLLDRGRVNIRIDRADDLAVVLLDKQLVARHFTSPPPEARRTVIPPNGQVVALQTQFGDVSNCDDSDPVEAELVVSYTIGVDPVVHRGSIEVDDPTTLDDIRLQICTQRRVIESNEFELQVDEVDGETMGARLVVRRREGSDRLAFDAVAGTVLFGAEAVVPAGSPERDPHAVGETTRKYGLDVYVAVDDVAAQRISVSIDAAIARLDEMLERCKERTGQ